MIPIGSRNKLRFISFLGPMFKDFGSPNGLPTSMFQAFFWTLVFNAFENQISIDISKPQTRKIASFPRENNDFCKMGVFDVKLRKSRILPSFSEAKTKKIDSKIESKNVLFLSSEFEGLFL